MKIFISWSGELSKSVALAFRDWLKLVIHGAEPFVSDEDIDKGTRGLAQIASELETTDVGIACITLDNFDRPWVNFEAGAISRRVGHGRLIPFLVNLENSDIPRHSPLTQFQTTGFNKADIHKMVHSINRSAQPQVTEDGVLDTLFDAVWDRLDQALREAIKNAELKSSSPVRTIAVGEMVGEILDLVRGQQRELAEMRAELGVLRRTGSLRKSVADSGMSFTPPVEWRTDIDQLVNALVSRLGRKPTVGEVAAALGIEPIELAMHDMTLSKVVQETESEMSSANDIPSSSPPDPDASPSPS